MDSFQVHCDYEDGNCATCIDTVNLVCSCMNRCVTLLSAQLMLICVFSLNSIHDSVCNTSSMETHFYYC